MAGAEGVLLRFGSGLIIAGITHRNPASRALTLNGSTHMKCSARDSRKINTKPELYQDGVAAIRSGEP